MTSEAIGPKGDTGVVGQTLQPKWWLCAAWFVVGVSYPLVVLGALSIGPLVAPFAIVATIVLSRVSGSRQAYPWLIVGAGLVPLTIAVINRHGPGSYCETVTKTLSKNCVEQWNPWPWLFVGILLFGLGMFLFRRGLAR